MERDKLVEQLAQIKEQEKNVLKQILAIDHQKNLDEANVYLKKYFIEKLDDQSVRCVFVYAIDQETCEPQALCINYWKDNEKSWFSIEFMYNFHPKKWDEADEWIEISKEEYLEHYNQVQKRIASSLFKDQL